MRLNGTEAPPELLFLLILPQSCEVHIISPIPWTTNVRLKKSMLVKIILLRSHLLNPAEGLFSFKELGTHFSGDGTRLNGYMR